MAQKPDTVVASLPFSEIEARMGIPSLASLLAERDTLVQQVAELRAKHGPFGVYGDLRKIELSKIQAVIRADAVAKGVKITEAAIEQESHAHAKYVEFVTEATKQKADYFVLENKITSIEDTIRRGNTVAAFLAAEVRLAQ